MRLSGLVAVKNEAEFIAQCLASLSFCDEVVVLDTGSSDDTVAIAKKAGARVIESSWEGFAKAHNQLAKEARGEWLLFVDADERVSKQLRELIILTLKDPQASAYQLKRLNFMMGEPLFHGGWYPDRMTRLIKKTALKGWRGELHEAPEVEGKVGFLDADLYHLTHRSVNWKLEKSMRYTQLSAQLAHKAGHPPVRVKNLFGAMAREFWYRAIQKAGWKDGFMGWVEILDQTFNAFLVQVQLWQLQQSQTMDKTYQKLDERLKHEWHD